MERAEKAEKEANPAKAAKVEMVAVRYLTKISSKIQTFLKRFGMIRKLKLLNLRYTTPRKKEATRVAKVANPAKAAKEKSFLKKMTISFIKLTAKPKIKKLLSKK